MLETNSVSQILAVLTKFRARVGGGDTIVEAQRRATREIARDYQVETPTISDLQTRRLKIKGIANFRDLLAKWLSGDVEPLRNVILQNTDTQDHERINYFFESTDIGYNVQNQVPFSGENETYNCRLTLDLAKKLKVLSLMKGISISDYLGEIAVGPIEEEYVKWLKTQKLTD